MGAKRDMSYSAGERQPAESPAYPAYPGASSRAGRAPRPPLTARMRRTHWIAIDCLAGGIFAILTMAVGVHGSPSAAAPVSGPLLRSPLVVIFIPLAVFIPVAFRRLAPVAAFGALLTLAGLLADGLPVASVVMFFASAYVLYMATVMSERRTGAAALMLGLAVTVVVAGIDHHVRHGVGTGAGAYVPAAFAMLIAWLTGHSMRQRRLYARLLQHEAASTAVAQERLRIARELHDVVAHSMSVIAVQAGYGQYVIDASPDDAREALGAIQATSRDALDEMRRMLGVLRRPDVPAPTGPGPAPTPAGRATPGPLFGSSPGPSPGPGTARSAARDPAARDPAGRDPAPLAPAPGLADLNRLVRRTCGAGVRVCLEVFGQARPAPAGIDLSAYRIVQEALTNVVRHAGTGAACTVSIGYTDADLIIRVTDDGGRNAASAGAHVTAHAVADAGTGHGIIGMRERVILCDGTFSAGPLPDGGFRVMATLPLPPAVTADAVPGAGTAGTGIPG